MKSYNDLIVAVGRIDKDAGYYLMYDARLLDGFKEDPLLSCCFHWSDTSQGASYWSDIAGRLYDTGYEHECEEESSETDCPVVSPNHYRIIGDYEAIDIIKSLLTAEEYNGYLKGNILKYTLRADKKNGTEDRKKSKVYTEWLIGENI